MRVDTEARSGSPASLTSAARDRAAVIGGLQPAWPRAYLLGRAFTARGAPADNLALHLAVPRARPGDVIVLDMGGERDTAHCGDLLARATITLGLAGTVLNGAMRDGAAIAELEYPIFHVGTSPRGPGKEVRGELGTFVDLCGIRVGTGDLVCADDDGAVVVAAAHTGDVLQSAQELGAQELEIERRILAGESTVAILGLEDTE
jgi:4-hydroxy-4-methyl-2-oxoglutarate aldolase